MFQRLNRRACDTNRIVPVSMYIAIGRFTRTAYPENQQAMIFEMLLPVTASENRSSLTTRYPLDRRRRQRLVQKDRARKHRQQPSRLAMRPLRTVVLRLRVRPLALKGVALWQRRVDRSSPRRPCPIQSCTLSSVTSCTHFCLQGRRRRLDRAQQQSQIYQRCNHRGRPAPV
jgi:hypothetical protein